MSGGIFKALVRYNIKRTALADEAESRAVLAPGAARTITRMQPDDIVREVQRQALIAVAQGIAPMKEVITAQVHDEVAALRVETPTTLRPLTDLDIAEEQAAQVAAKGPGEST